MDKQLKGWVQPAKQAFIGPPAMPASQLLDKPSPTHQSANSNAVGKEKKVNLSLVDRVYCSTSAAQIQPSLLQGSSAQEAIQPV